MFNKKTNTAISKATPVAEETNDDSNLENNIQSEFVILSADEIADAENNSDQIRNALVPVASTTKKGTDGKKTSTSTQQNDAKITHAQQEEVSTRTDGKKTSSKKKGGPSASMLNLIKDQQIARRNAELKAEEEAKQNRLRQEEYDRREQEKLRLEEAYREKRKEKKKERVQRQRQDGTYLTKEQREKRQRAQVQLEAAGIHIPARNISQSTISLDHTSGTKRVLYADHRHTNKTLSSTSLQPTTTVIKAEDTTFAEEGHSDEETIFDNALSTGQMTGVEVKTHLIANEESSETESTDSEEDETDRSLSPMERVRRRLERHHQICENRRSIEVLRAPVICVLGHVDAGKTTILDNLRRTHVQNNEAGGITQQIGATNVPLETILERTKMCRTMISRQGDFIVPGLMIIDTPGHATFKNLRLRGSSLCDLAIVVVDIMNGLQEQTIESIRLLTAGRTPFIVALNKIDLLYGWKSDKERDVECVLREQSTFTQDHYTKRCNEIIVQFAEQGLNVALYYKNSDPNNFYSMVPTSARSGDGMGSLIGAIIEQSQTSLAKRISYTDELQATVMEVKAIHGFGTTIDVALVNGCLSVGDKIVIAGQEGPILTHIRGLLIPESNQELRVTNQYNNIKKVSGARGLKILAKGLEKSMAGLPLFVARKPDEIDYFKAEIETILKSVLNSINLQDTGVYVQASTLGSLEAFLELLTTHKIPCSGVNIGPVHRRDVMRASTQLEKDIQWGTILAFDVKIEKDAQEYAKTIGVAIFQNDEVYKLYDMFTAHREQLIKENQEKYRHLAVFPCKLRILPACIFNAGDPIVCGVRVEEGFLQLGTPICVPSKDGIDLGRVVSMEMNHKPLDIARKGSEVCIKIILAPGESSKHYGRHFDHDDILMSKISRQSIDVVKKYFREELREPDWRLMIELKNVFHII